MRKKLLLFNYKTISLDQLTKLAGNIDYTDLVDKINNFVEECLIEPVKASGKNGRRTFSLS